MKLPNDVWIYISSFLDIVNLDSFKNICHNFYKQIKINKNTNYFKIISQMENDKKYSFEELFKWAYGNKETETYRIKRNMTVNEIIYKYSMPMGKALTLAVKNKDIIKINNTLCKHKWKGHFYIKYK
jgi:hypothetical protein